MQSRTTRRRICLFPSSRVIGILISGPARPGDGDLRNHRQGAVYVFVKPTAGWQTTPRYKEELTESNGTTFDQFGLSVAISGDTTLIGSPFTSVNGGSESRRGLCIRTLTDIKLRFDLMACPRGGWQ